MKDENRTVEFTHTLAGMLQTFLAGAVAQNMSDGEVARLVSGLLEDETKELTTIEAADYLNKTKATLERWRWAKTGPRYRKEQGGQVRYRTEWLREFQEGGQVIEGRDTSDTDNSPF